jgi:GT2 family glycosyltransferase
MPRLSICMVSFNCRKVIEDCLVSLERSTFRDFETIVVDNGSVDGTLEYLRGRTDVRLIENGYNAGFTKGTNQGIVASSGEYLLWLNTDTILEEDSLGALVDFLDKTPKAGIVGPRVLNPDGSFQPQCKRGMPTPLASLSYALGLDRLFPNSPTMAGYLLRYIPDTRTAIVAGVSGCCLMATRDVWNDIGPLDEEMFAFGEDLEWCVRAQKSGWQVWYYPGSTIVHLKGQGGAHARPYKKVKAMHDCMWIFYRKHLQSLYPGIATLLVRAGIWASFAASMARVWLGRQLHRLSSSASS